MSHALHAKRAASSPVPSPRASGRQRLEHEHKSTRAPAASHSPAGRSSASAAATPRAKSAAGGSSMRPAASAASSSASSAASSAAGKRPLTELLTPSERSAFFSRLTTRAAYAWGCNWLELWAARCPPAKRDDREIVIRSLVAIPVSRPDSSADLLQHCLEHDPHITAADLWVDGSFFDEKRSAYFSLSMAKDSASALASTPTRKSARTSTRAQSVARARGKPIERNVTALHAPVGITNPRSHAMHICAANACRPIWDGRVDADVLACAPVLSALLFVCARLCASVHVLLATVCASRMRACRRCSRARPSLSASSS